MAKVYCKQTTCSHHRDGCCTFFKPRDDKDVYEKIDSGCLGYHESEDN